MLHRQEEHKCCESLPTGPTLRDRENARIVRRWFHEVWNLHRTATIAELVSEGVTCVSDDLAVMGPAEFRRMLFDPITTAFPDVCLMIDDLLASGGDVVVRWTSWGTHRGVLAGIPPTHLIAEIRGISWLRLRNGKLVEGWQNTNIPRVLALLAAAAARPPEPQDPGPPEPQDPGPPEPQDPGPP